MKCPECKIDVGQLKKNQYVYCRCGAQLMCIEVNKKLELVILGENEGEGK